MGRPGRFKPKNSKRVVVPEEPDVVYEADATLVLHGAGEWSDEGRQIIADWLRKQADALVKDGREYAKRFRARYLHPVEPSGPPSGGDAGARPPAVLR